MRELLRQHAQRRGGLEPHHGRTVAGERDNGHRQIDRPIRQHDARLRVRDDPRDLGGREARVDRDQDETRSRRRIARGDEPRAVCCEHGDAVAGVQMREPVEQRTGAPGRGLLVEDHARSITLRAV